MRHSAILLALLLVVSDFAAPAAWAAWPNDANVNLPICTAVKRQNVPSICSDGAGGVIIAWMDGRDTVATHYDTYVQRVNAAGVPQWTADGVAICTAVGDQWWPSITSDGAGGAIVAWFDSRNGGRDIYAQRVNAAGVPMWIPNGVPLCTNAFTQQSQTIASDGAGGAIVTWEDTRSGSGFDIYAQRVSAAGVPQWTADGVAICTAADDQRYPAIALDGSSGAIIIWRDRRSGANYDVYAQRVDAGGVPLWTPNGVALCATINDQLNSTVDIVYAAQDIVSDGAGGAIVAWYDFRNGTNYDIYAQRVNPAGVPVWSPGGLALCTVPFNQVNPTLSPDGAGGAIVAWEDSRSGTNFDIVAQRVNATGVPLWPPNGVPLCTLPGDQTNPAIVADGAGGAIVTFEDQSGGNHNIVAQRVHSGGASMWGPNGVPLCTAPNDRYVPAIASDGAAGAIVTWEDFRPGPECDIYAQNVNADGTLGGSLLSAPPSTVAARFALHSIQPNPSFGDFSVSFSLPDGSPATLELYDLAGRRIESLPVGSLGPGAHVTSLAARANALPPGVYSVRLTQGSHRAVSRVAILR